MSLEQLCLHNWAIDNAVILLNGKIIILEQAV